MTKLFPTQKQNFKRLGKSDEGQALVLTALALIVLMLMAGLGVDVGFLRYQKQQMQKAADAGALAGASALVYGGNWNAAARSDTAANGYADTVNGATVHVYVPPIDPPFSTDPNATSYVEVVVSQPEPAFFMRVGGVNTVPVASRAVASARTPASGCIYVMDPSAPSSYTGTGGALITASCGIYVNSTSPNAFDQNGSGCTKASTIAISGGIKTDSCSQPATPQTGVHPQADPLATVPAPTVGPIPGSCVYQAAGQTAFTPGTYCGGINLNSAGPYTFSTGLYILYGGGLTINSQAVVTGTGVTFYNTGTQSGPLGFKAITINGGGSVNLSAPVSSDATTGAIAGMLFFEDRNPAANGQITNTVTGLSGSTFTGALYFLTTALTYAGSSSQNGYTTIVADTVKITGTSTIGDNYSGLTGGPLIQGASLVQ